MSEAGYDSESIYILEGYFKLMSDLIRTPDPDPGPYMSANPINLVDGRSIISLKLINSPKVFPVPVDNRNNGAVIRRITPTFPARSAGENPLERSTNHGYEQHHIDQRHAGEPFQPAADPNDGDHPDPSEHGETREASANSALDDPINFFAAQGHTQRASDLAMRKDEMSEAIQTIKAADNGISAITDMIASAKSLAQSALATNIYC